MEAAKCRAGTSVSTAAAAPGQKTQAEADADIQFSMSMQEASRVADAAPRRKHLVSAPRCSILHLMRCDAVQEACQDNLPCSSLLKT